MPTPTPTPAPPGRTRSLRDRIHDGLQYRLGAAQVEEIARAGAAEIEVIEAMYDFQRDGLVAPTVWRHVR